MARLGCCLANGHLEIRSYDDDLFVIEVAHSDLFLLFAAQIFGASSIILFDTHFITDGLDKHSDMKKKASRDHLLLPVVFLNINS